MSLSAPLTENGFEPVETDLPGDWASNDTHTVQITTRRDVDGRRINVARVYDGAAGMTVVASARLVTVAESQDHVTATRLALEGVPGL